MLSAWHNTKAKLSGRFLDPSDVLVHGPQSVLQTPIMNSIEALLA
jgi:hypothetical protein